MSDLFWWLLANGGRGRVITTRANADAAHRKITAAARLIRKAKLAMDEKQPLTDDETQRFAETVHQILPLASLITMNLDAESVALLKRGLRGYDEEASRLQASSVAYMAIGIDVDRMPAAINAKVNAPIVRALIGIWEALEEGKRVLEKEEERTLMRDRILGKLDM